MQAQVWLWRRQEVPHGSHKSPKPPALLSGDGHCLEGSRWAASPNWGWGGTSLVDLQGGAWHFPSFRTRVTWVLVEVQMQSQEVWIGPGVLHS